MQTGVPGDALRPDDVAALVRACTAALSSPLVAERLADCIAALAVRTDVSRVICASAGATDAVIAAMSAHGAVSPSVAACGCKALGYLSFRDTGIAEALVLSAGGLDVVLSVMGQHPRDREVQWKGCFVLRNMAAAASPAALTVMKSSRAVELLLAAKATYPAGGDFVVHWADQALGSLASQ